MLFEQMRFWWESEDTAEPLCLSGPTGCGKTSTVMQFMARLNAPVIAMTCRRRMDKSELLGSFVVQGSQGHFAWQDGPAAIAWSKGAVLVINEFSLAPAEVWVACNDILEGGDLYIPQTGETIKRHPNTRVVITDNCAMGDVDGSDEYLGRQMQDLSTIDRFMHIRCGYLPQELELSMLRRKTCGEKLSKDEKEITSCAVKLAGLLRASEGTAPVLSTRVLLRLVKILLQWAAAGKPKSIKSPLKMALDLSIAAALPEVMQSALYGVSITAFSEYGSHKALIGDLAC